MSDYLCDIFKAQDGRYYARLESGLDSKNLDYYGPFKTLADLLIYFQLAYGKNEFRLDETGHRPVPPVSVTPEDELRRGGLIGPN